MHCVNFMIDTVTGLCFNLSPTLFGVLALGIVSNKCLLSNDEADLQLSHSARQMCPGHRQIIKYHRQGIINVGSSRGIRFH